MGNSCYMNAGLQCICSVPQIAGYFLCKLCIHLNYYYGCYLYFCSDNVQTADDTAQYNSEGEAVQSQQKNSVRNECSAELIKQFGVLLRKLWSGQCPYVCPKAFKMSLGLVDCRFAGTEQVC